MENVIDRINAMIADLRSNASVNLVCDFVGEPTSSEKIAEFEREIGDEIDPALKAFYTACNGVSICWQPASTDPQWLMQYQDGPVWYFEESEGGQLIIEPIEEVFGPRMGNHDIREMSAEGHEHPISVFGNSVDGEEYFRTMWVLSWFFEGNAVMINSKIKDENGVSSFVVQGDQGLESPVQDRLTFESWFDFSIKSWGSTAEQRRIYTSWENRTIPESLDSLVPKPNAVPVMLYRLNEVPNVLTEGVPDGDVQQCLFWIIADSKHTAKLFAERTEPNIDHVNEGMVAAEHVALAAVCTRMLAELLKPDEHQAGGHRYGGNYSVGFHTGNGDEIEKWFQAREFEIIPSSEVFDHLFFARVRDTESNPIEDVEVSSFSVNVGLKSKPQKISPGLFAFDLLDEATSHFQIVTENGNHEIHSADCPAGTVVEVAI